jgi:hypothetical protein
MGFAFALIRELWASLRDDTVHVYWQPVGTREIRYGVMPIVGPGQLLASNISLFNFTYDAAIPNQVNMSLMAQTFNAGQETGRETLNTVLTMRSRSAQ